MSDDKVSEGKKLDPANSLPRIGIFGSSLNPPGNHHIFIAKELAKFFDKTFIIPCGIRTDKPSTASASPANRKEMTKLAFSKIPDLEIDFYDLDNNIFTPTWFLDQKYRKLFLNYEIWNIVGGDIIEGGHERKSEIQRVWQKGEEIWKSLNWAIIDQPDCQIDARDLPPNNLLIKMGRFKGRSTKIRNNITAGLPITDLVPQKIEYYITKNNLYR